MGTTGPGNVRRRRAPFRGVSAPFIIAIALALAAPTAIAQEGGGGSGGGSGGGGGGGGDVSYADLIVALRDVDGLPILAEFPVEDEETGETVIERCVRPISPTEIPGVSAETNPVDGRTVWPVPLLGDLPTSEVTAAEPGDDEEEEDEVEVCDPQAAFADYVVEAELERLNMVRTTDSMMEFKLGEVATWLAEATEITLDGGGRIMTDGAIHDAPPEYAAIFWSLMTTGTLPNLPTSPAYLAPLDWLGLSAAAMGTTSGKEIPIGIDAVVYYNRIQRVFEEATWPLAYRESALYASAGTQITEKVADYRGFSYDRATTFPGCATWLDVPTLSWRSGPVGDLIGFADLPPIAEDGVVDNIAGYAQFADDARAVILYMHEHDVIPGFFIDPIGTNSCDAQAAALSRRPAVNWDDVPALFVRTHTDQVTASAYNPVTGDVLDHALLQVTVDAPAAFRSAGQLTATAVDGSGSVAFTLVGDDLVGRFGPTGGFPMPAAYQDATEFDVTFSDDAPTGEYRLTLELVDLNRGGLTVATDVQTTTLLDDGPGTDPDAPSTDPEPPSTDPDAPSTDPDAPSTDPGDDTGVLPDPGVERSSTERTGGRDRIETAVLASRLGFPEGARTALLARADLYPDALAGVPLAGMLQAPVLLTYPTELAPDVLDELSRLEVDHVVLLGGPQALSDDLVAALQRAGIGDVDRVAGADRFETAARIAERLAGTHAYVVEGADPDPARGWPDALAVGPLAARQQSPILLVETDRLPEATAQALQRMQAVTVAGGEVAVAEQVMAQVRAHVRTVDRVAGADRYATALRLADLLVAAGADPAHVFVATGEAPPDALAAGAATAATNGVLLLIDGQRGIGAAGEWLAAHDDAPMKVHVMGGPHAVTEAVMAQLGAAVGGRN